LTSVCESLSCTWKWLSTKSQSRSPPQIGGPLQVAIGLKKVEDEQKGVEFPNWFEKAVWKQEWDSSKKRNSYCCEEEDTQRGNAEGS